MATTINVQIAVDTYYTVNRGSPRLFMFDDNAADRQGQGSSEITINASVGDTIVWDVCSLDPLFSCTLIAFQYTGGTQVLQPGQLPNGLWTGQVKAKGNETYHFIFMINGYPTTYQWDPYINIP